MNYNLSTTSASYIYIKHTKQNPFLSSSVFCVSSVCVVFQYIKAPIEEKMENFLERREEGT